MTTSAADFLSLAEREASRHGGESMVFLRELLQNARDAGARKVVIETRVEQGVEAITVTDDGRGMALEHAQRFLLTLYASSKRGNADTAGQFGVGFWSVLRFEPTEITLRSRSVGAEEGWEIVFDSGLGVRDHRKCRMPVGTSIRMVRPARTGDLGTSAWELVRRDSRHLRQTAPSEELLEVLVNGRQATEPIAAQEPGIVFRRSGLRGAVSLGAIPEVILLAHGLRVRAAASVDDLLLRPDRRLKKYSQVPTSGLSPRVVIDSDRLAVLMDRGDVAQDRALVAVARVIRSETRRLCEMELERLAPRSLWQRIRDTAVGRRLAIGVSVLMLAGVVFGLWGAAILNERLSRSGIPGPPPAAGGLTPKSYFDRSFSYGGPVTERIEGVGGVPDLAYRPPDQRPFLAAFHVAGIDEGGKPLKNEWPLRLAERWDGSSASSLKIELGFLASTPLLRLPVSTGHVVDAASVLLNGHSANLWLTPDNEPVLRLDSEKAGRVAYRTVERAFEIQGAGRWPVLPPAVARRAAGLEKLPSAQRVDEAIKLVRVSLGSSGQFENSNSGNSQPAGFFGPVFRAGGGDCDVVNTVLAAVLSKAGLRSRLAIGWRGAGGAPMPGLHAWVEVDLGAGRWVPADATVPITGGAVVPQTEQTVELCINDRPEGNPDRSLWRVGLLGGSSLILVVVLVVRKFKIQREFNTPGDLDTGPLVESLVRDREAWPGFAGARRRDLVPAHGADRQSLAGIEDAALSMDLFVAESPGEWVARAREGGAMVLDGSTHAGRVAASAFGAFDLGRWEDLWQRSRTDSLCLEIQEALLQNGMKLKIRRADGVAGGVGSGFLVDGGATAWMVIDDDNRQWRLCRDRMEENRAEAIFRAVDIVFAVLPSSGAPAQQALAALARDALKAMEQRPV